MRERLQLLSSLESMQTASGPEFDRWADTRLDRWLTDWALRAGKERTARKLAQQRGIEVGVFRPLDIVRVKLTMSCRRSGSLTLSCSQKYTG